MVKSTPNKAIKRIMNVSKELPRGLHAHSMRHSFEECRAAAMDIVGASFSQLGSNPAPLRLAVVN